MEATKPEIVRILCATDLSDKFANTHRYAIQKARELGIETTFDLAVAMKPCNIGT